MPRTTYEHLAGHAAHRLAGLAGGVFAIAMTLIILEIRTPAHDAVHSEATLWAALVALAPKFLTFALSFLTLGIFWLAQQAQLDQLEHSDRDLVWIHIGFLACICMLPFSTALLGEFLQLRVALLFYWLNIALAGVALYASWHHIRAAGLAKSTLTDEAFITMRRRIVGYQAAYAVCAALCVFGTPYSIGLLVVAQLHSVLGVRWPFARRRAGDLTG